MMPVSIYHTPRCSKSRQTLQLLQDKGIEPQIIKYLETPPDHDTLVRILDMLGIGPRDLMRKKEKEYQDNDLGNPDLGREQLIDALVAHPRLIERPIVITNNKAALGRPPEQVLDIL